MLTKKKTKALLTKGKLAKVAKNLPVAILREKKLFIAGKSQTKKPAITPKNLLQSKPKILTTQFIKEKTKNYY